MTQVTPVIAVSALPGKAAFHSAAIIPSVQPSILALSIKPQAISAGQVFSVDIEVSAPAQQPLIAWQLDLAFDPRIVQLQGAQEGAFFRQSSLTKDTFFHPGFTDNVHGRLTAIAGASMGVPQGQGCTGTGVLATLHFSGLAGSTPGYLLASNILVGPITVDGSGLPIVPTYAPSQFLVSGVLTRA